MRKRKSGFDIDGTHYHYVMLNLKISTFCFPGLLASTSIGISLFFSPVWISLCKTKSTRLSGVFGGLLVSLGMLFTSFASQFHQLFFSYGAFIGINKMTVNVVINMNHVS